MSVPRDIERMRKNKQEYIDSIAEESDMDSEKEREIIREVLDEKIIKEEFLGSQTAKDRIEPSLLDDIKCTMSSKGASRGRAEIVSVEAEESDIKVIFSIIGRDDGFTKSYDIPQSDIIDGELGDLLIMTEADNPNKLKGCVVPVVPSNIRGDVSYTIHKPPREEGLWTRLGYRWSIISRRFELFRYNIGEISKDIYTPTGRLYAILLFVSLVLFSGGLTGKILGTVWLLFVFFIFIVHMMSLTECR